MGDEKGVGIELLAMGMRRGGGSQEIRMGKKLSGVGGRRGSWVIRRGC